MLKYDHKVGFWVALFIIATLTLSPAQSFAALTIIPAGSQSLDIATGISQLPEGGEIIDATQKLSLKANKLELKEGEFISATAATVVGEFGMLSSPSIFINMQNQQLQSSAVELSYKNLLITADKLVLFLDADIASLKGNVESRDPSFTASNLTINLKTGLALLGSPFEYENGPLVLQQENEGKKLQLSPSESDEGSLSYQASSQIDQIVLEALSPYFLP